MKRRLANQTLLAKPAQLPVCHDCELLDVRLVREKHRRDSASLTLELILCFTRRNDEASKELEAWLHPADAWLPNLERLTTRGPSVLAGLDWERPWSRGFEHSGQVVLERVSSAHPIGRASSS